MCLGVFIRMRKQLCRLTAMTLFLLAAVGCGAGSRAPSASQSAEEATVALAPPEKEFDAGTNSGADTVAEDPLLPEVSGDPQQDDSSSADSAPGLDAGAGTDAGGVEQSAAVDPATEERTPSHVERIQQAFQSGDVAAAIAIADEARQESPDDAELHQTLVGLLIYQGRSEPDRATAGAALIRAGKTGRELFEKHGAADPRLKEILAPILFYEARGHAVTGNSQEATRALREAAAEGFQDAANVYMDDFFESVRGNAEFSQLVADLIREETRKQLAADESFAFDFRLPSVAGDVVSLADFKGKVTVVDFWGTWCPPCRMEVPHFVKLKEKFGEQLAIVGINYENGDNEEQIKTTISQFAQDLGINYPCLLGDEATQQQVPVTDSQFPFPTTLFIDRSGRVRLKALGYHPYQKLEAIVQALMDEENGAT
jgi:thiol-disulfide isomerase/thioredoxin